MATIVLDAMGGDAGVEVTVEGAVNAVKKNKNIKIVLVGRENLIINQLKKLKYYGPDIIIEDAQDVISMKDSPSNVIRNKRDSSIMRGMNIVKENKAQAFVSAGNSGAIMASAMFLLRTLPNINRPAIASFLPTLQGICAMLDVGGNVDCKPKNLLQFAIMGNIFMAEIFNIGAPKVGLLSIGSEETKGNELVLESYKLLKGSGLNFIGNIEGGDITLGTADVVVCDGFIGNIILKFGEGAAEMLFKLIKIELKKHPITFISVPFLWSALKDLMKKVDYTEYGGAPLLGINGVCIICHGRSNAKAVANAVVTANEFINKDINGKISKEMEKYANILQ